MLIMNFCTLFDSNYATRGLAMYNSLVGHCEDFTLYILAFDNEVMHILHQLKLPNVYVISMDEFEDERIKSVKKTRTRGEYCWTCSSLLIRYVIQKYELREVTYLDSDLYFFNTPQILLKELYSSGKDVLITEHRYTHEYDQTNTSGKYCVQFMTFRATENGMHILNWWCERCMEWCYNRMEDGKFGDQKYLDDWTARFKGVYVLRHLGGGVAPWNVQQYAVSFGPKVNELPIVFYHFHGFRWYSNNIYNLSDYRLTEQIVENIYSPYIVALNDALDIVRETYNKSFSLGVAGPTLLEWAKISAKYLLKKLCAHDNNILIR